MNRGVRAAPADGMALERDSASFGAGGAAYVPSAAIAAALEVVAALLLASDLRAASARMLGVGAALCGHYGITLQENVEADLHAETSAAVRARLSESEFNRCFDEGAKSDIYAAIDTGLAALRMLD